MRLLTFTILAAVALPAPAALAQIDESDLPDLLPDGKATFNVSLYGVQRYESHSVKRENPNGGPFNERGETTSRSKVTFHTKRPTRAQLTRTGGYLSLRWLTKDDIPLPVVAEFAHSGEDRRESTNLTAADWQPVPPPDAENCEATVDWLGFGLSFSGGRIEASQARDNFVPIGDPFNGCPWGDRSLGLYSAKGRLPDALLGGRETEIVLRGKRKDHSEGPLYTSDMRQQTTIQVTFKKVG